MHAMLHVTDMERTLAFYCGVLGMTVQVDRYTPETRHRNVFAGYGPYDQETMVEFVSYGVGRQYEKGDGFGHLAIGVADLAETCRQLAAAGVMPLRGPKLAPSGAQIAIIRDPEGYEIELIQPAQPA